MVVIALGPKLALKLGCLDRLGLQEGGGGGVVTVNELLPSATSTWCPSKRACPFSAQGPGMAKAQQNRLK